MKTILVLSAVLACFAFGQAQQVKILSVCGEPSRKGQFEDMIVDYYAAADKRVIFPGTKWCGNGNDAENDDDLGTAVDTDKCCRAHDKCDDSMAAGESKHGLTNTGKYTKLNCKCDCAFKNCLKNASSMVSASVGKLYFNWVPTQCYQEEYPIVECNKRSGFPHYRCLSYIVDVSKPKVFQWFDVPLY